MTAPAALARRALKTIAAGADAVRPPGAGLVILLYHRVGGGSGGEVDLVPEDFAHQLDFLAERRSVVSLDEGLALLDGGSTTPRPPVVLTFDDGTADFVEHALPALRARSLPVTLYLATAAVDEARPFWGDGPPLTWAALRDACEFDGITIGSHGHAHRAFALLSPGEARADLDRATDLLGEHLGVTPRHFAYPHAVAPTPAVEVVVRTTFVSAALEGCGVNEVGRYDPYRLRRSAIQVSDGDRFFRRKVAGGLRLEAAVRGYRADRRARAPRS